MTNFNDGQCPHLPRYVTTRIGIHLLHKLVSIGKRYPTPSRSKLLVVTDGIPPCTPHTKRIKGQLITITTPLSNKKNGKKLKTFRNQQVLQTRKPKSKDKQTIPPQHSTAVRTRSPQPLPHLPSPLTHPLSTTNHHHHHPPSPSLPSAYSSAPLPTPLLTPLLVLPHYPAPLRHHSSSA